MKSSRTHDEPEPTLSTTFLPVLINNPGWVSFDSRADCRLAFKRRPAVK